MLLKKSQSFLRKPYLILKLFWVLLKKPMSFQLKPSADFNRFGANFELSCGSKWGVVK